VSGAPLDRDELGGGAARARLREMAVERTAANERFFSAHAERLARLCHGMAERFARGGRLIAVGASPSARSDARHVAVEFVHPVIVGKRALPAIGLAGEDGDVAAQLELLAGGEDIVIAFETGEGAVAQALELAAGRGCLTIAFAAIGAQWEFPPPSEDPAIAQELVETLYHVLWELVHVFFEHRGLLDGRAAAPVHDAGASSFLYPFLAERETGLETVVADVAASVRIKAEEIGALRERTLRESCEPLLAAARSLRESFDRGGRLLAFGNGGSATDAMDVVADFSLTSGRHLPRPAIDLAEDGAILTAIANDIGVEAIFSRQVIAQGRRGDCLLALSTSGSSPNVLAALAEGRRGGLCTIAMIGYDGGRIASEALADHVLVVRSEHIPRIQEAQASLYHALRELVEMVAA
jgi:D-sedoheptulose 7-phosphate isomerase